MPSSSRTPSATHRKDKIQEWLNSHHKAMNRPPLRSLDEIRPCHIVCLVRHLLPDHPQRAQWPKNRFLQMEVLGNVLKVLMEETDLADGVFGVQDLLMSQNGHADGGDARDDGGNSGGHAVVCHEPVVALLEHLRAKFPKPIASGAHDAEAALATRKRDGKHAPALPDRNGRPSLRDSPAIVVNGAPLVKRPKSDKHGFQHKRSMSMVPHSNARQQARSSSMHAIGTDTGNANKKDMGFPLNPKRTQVANLVSRFSEDCALSSQDDRSTSSQSGKSSTSAHPRIQSNVSRARERFEKNPKLIQMASPSMETSPTTTQIDRSSSTSRLKRFSNLWKRQSLANGDKDVVEEPKNLDIRKISSVKSRLSLSDMRNVSSQEQSYYNQLFNHCENISLRNVHAARHAQTSYHRSEAVNLLIGSLFSDPQVAINVLVSIFSGHTGYLNEFDQSSRSFNRRHLEILISNYSGMETETSGVNAQIQQLLGLFSQPRLIVAYPHRHIPAQEHDFLVKYASLLFREPRLFSRVMCAIDWSADETPSHMDSIMDYVRLVKLHGQLGIQDALELLSWNELTHRNVSSVSIDILRQNYDTTEMSHFILCLFQLLRYEDPESLLQQDKSPLATFLLDLSSQSSEIANRIFWYCQVEKSVHYKYFYTQLLHRLTSTQEGLWSMEMAVRQQRLVDGLTKISIELKDSGLNRYQKMGRLRTMLKTVGAPYYFEHVFDEDHCRGVPFTLPLHAGRRITGFHAGEAKLFKSAMEPMLLSFSTDVPGESYLAIFKRGDDLRQDHLVMELIEFIDHILKYHNVDCQLSPYRIMATGADTGFLEVVRNSSNLARVLEKYRNRLNDYFLEMARQGLDHLPEGPEKEQAFKRKYETMMNNFVRSCAGYCVITYLLGIGDRHLDNLLLDKQGRLFHIDFGFILGKDPKPFPPPMRITDEMIALMGGQNGRFFVAMQVYACQVFKILRQYSTTLQQMLICLDRSNIPQIHAEAIHNIVDARFCMDLSESEADQHIVNCISDSSKMLVPKINETIHKFVQNFRM